MKVFLFPNPAVQAEDNGIGRVIAAQAKHLPALGVEFVEDWKRADVLNLHTQMFDIPTDVPFALSLHGLYWLADRRGEYGSWHNELNGKIFTAARRARAITVPSNWVAEPFKRDMRLTPDVINHGIDIKEWEPYTSDKRGPYVLFNKNRPGDVCSPLPAWELARRGIPVVSTFAPEGKSADTLQVIGVLPGEKMKDCIKRADVYLATTQETFGVGTLEALAAGVPVLGYAWAGTRDIVRHGIDGYLVSPGDIKGLVEGYEWIKANRDALSQGAQERARAFTWTAAAEKYFAVYKRIVDNPVPAPATAVVISAFNYGKYLDECIQSVLNQTLPANEIIVVDDGSTDDTAAVAVRYSDRIRYVYQENQGVAEARNRGVRETVSPFVVCLDADDRLGRHYLEAVQPALAADPGHGIAYTGLGLILPDGSVSPNVWQGNFNWEWQASAGMPPHTTIPTAATFRREAWKRVGGYRQYYAPGEDAEFYTRLLASGWTAVRAIDSPLIEYRDHGGGAHLKRPYLPIDDDKPWMRDGKFPMAAPAIEPPLVRSYSEPLVSVIMPVGPEHDIFLPRAIASVEGEGWRNWELIVVNDTGAPLDKDMMRPYPYVRVIEMNGTHGSGAARNAGIDAAMSPLVLFLDADDQLMPDAMKLMLRAFTEHEGRYIYTQWSLWNKQDVLENVDVPEYDPAMAMRTGLHAITVLMGTDDAASIRFDENLKAFEDYDFFARAASLGVHGWKLAQPLVVVDVQNGLRTQVYIKQRDALTAAIRSRYDAYLTGGKVAAPCCGSGGAGVMAIKARLDGEGGDVMQVTGSAPENATVRMRYTGNEKGASSYFGNQGRTYRAGDNPLERFINAHPDDVDKLLNMGVFARVAQVPTSNGATAQPAAQNAALPPLPMRNAIVRPSLRVEVPATNGNGIVRGAVPATMPAKNVPAGMVLGNLSAIQTAQTIPVAEVKLVLTPMPTATPITTIVEPDKPLPAALKPTEADQFAWPDEIMSPH